jgi:hypothetical protein
MVARAAESAMRAPCHCAYVRDVVAFALHHTSTAANLLTVLCATFLPPGMHVFITIAALHVISLRSFAMLTPPGTETPSRTSSSCFFVKEAAEHPVVEAVEELIAALFADPRTGGTGRRPVGKTEALQGGCVRGGGMRV